MATKKTTKKAAKKTSVRSITVKKLVQKKSNPQGGGDAQDTPVTVVVEEKPVELIQEEISAATEQQEPVENTPDDTAVEPTRKKTTDEAAKEKPAKEKAKEPAAGGKEKGKIESRTWLRMQAESRRATALRLKTQTLKVIQSLLLWM